MRLHWPSLLAFACFWCYGLYASIHLGPGLASWLLTAALAVITAGFSAMPRTGPFIDPAPISRAGLAALAPQAVLFVALLGALAYRDLASSLQGDQLFHAQYSQVHPQKAIRLLAQKRGWFLDWSFRDLIWASDLALAALGTALVWGLARLKPTARFLAVLILAFVLRSAVNSLGGNPDTHPAFRLFPAWLVSTVFCSRDFVFRLPSFLALVAVSVWLFRHLRQELGSRTAFLVAMAAASLPVVLHVGTLDEPSIWLWAAWTVVLFSLPAVYSQADDDRRRALWFRLSSILAIGTMMRQPTFVAYAPLFAALAWRERGRLTSHWPALLPCLAMLPQTVGAILLKTPATQSVAAHSMLSGLISAVAHGTVYRIALSSLFGYGIALIPWAIVPCPRHSPVLAAVRALWLATGIGIFFSINPELWGNGRYQAEYLAPFAAYGLYQALVLLKSWTRSSAPRVPVQSATAAIALSIVLVNAYCFIALPSLNPSVDELMARGSMHPPIRILSQMTYETGPAYDYLREAGYAGKTYYAGLGYGNFAAIMHGYSVRQWINEFEILSAVEKGRAQGASSESASRLGSLKAQDILSVPGIQAVLVGDLNAPQGIPAFVSELEAAGFKRVREFKNATYGSTLLLLARSL